MCAASQPRTQRYLNQTDELEETLRIDLNVLRVLCCSPRVTLLTLRRGNAAVRARLVTTWLLSKSRRLRVDRLESGSAVAGYQPPGARSAPWRIFLYIADRLHQTTSLHADPHCSLFPLLPPLSCFFFSLSPPDQDKPSCVLFGQLFAGIIEGAKKRFHCSIGDW